MNLDETIKMLEEKGYKLLGKVDTSQNDASEELEKENFTEEEFKKACEDLGLEDSGVDESDDVDDFFTRLNQI